MGDAMLSEVAERLRNIVRLQDEVSRAHQSGRSSSVARWGGDEFLLAVIDLTSGKDAASVASRILESLKAPFQYAGRAFHLSGSIGISLYPDDSKDPVELLHFAAMALNQTKSSGRNHFAFFSPSMNDQARARFGLDAELHRALEMNEITVHYQPIVEAATGRVVGVEALARWLHPRTGMIGPDRFIPAAERLGLIDELSRQLIRITSEHLRSWREKALPPFYVSINISGRQFRDPNLAKTLISAVKRAGVGPQDILLEVTEGVLIDDLTEGERILAKLKELGFRIAIDDFGTGYSSLSYVKRFPVDVLKIDREFIRDIAIDERDRVMATGVLFLAQGLGVEAVAEGVETEEQRNLLIACGCPLMQGYLFAKAMPAEKLAALMARTGGIIAPEIAPSAGTIGPDRRHAGGMETTAADGADRYRALEQERRQSIRPAIRRSA
jgi:diguanylate cyclase (GGDEF)-like protein